MSVKGNIFLIGPMGVGKSTIGRVLADIMNLRFVDSDQEIESNTGANIPWIFDVEGENGFREREHKILVEVCSMTPCVIATGGGIVIREDNRKLLIKEGVSIYLQASVSHQMNRISNDRSRPLIREGDPGEVLKKLLITRDPLYREVAEFVFPTDAGKPKITANKIAQKLQKLNYSFQ